MMEVTLKRSTKLTLDSVDVELVLNNLNIPFEPILSDEVRILCPWHKEEEPSLFISLTKRIYHCLGCHRRGTIFTFIKDVTGWNNRETIEFLKKIHGDIDLALNGFANVSEMDKQNRSDVQKLAQINHMEPLETIDENFVIRWKTSNIPYLKNRGFIEKTIDQFELGFCTYGHYQDRIIIPIYDEQHRLVGFSSRKITAEKDIKYKHKAGFDKNRILYNLYFAKQYSEKMPMMICEGFSDVWRAYQFGYPCTVAVMGDRLSLAQEKLALQYGYKFILAFDGDSAGWDGMYDAAQRLKYYAKVFILRVPDNMDVGSLSREQFKQYLMTAREVR